MTARAFSKTSAALRLRLIAMILTLVGPLALFQALELVQVKSTRTRLTQQQAYDLAKAGAARYQDMIDDARSVLELLSRVAEVTAEGDGVCSRFLGDVVRTHVWARSIFVANSSSVVVCGTIPGARNFDLSKREWFREARASASFSVSDFVVSQVTGQPSAFASFFFRNIRTGEQQVIAAELDLGWIDRLSASIGDRKDSLVMLVDGSGVVISRFPAASVPGFARLSQDLRQHVGEPTTELFAGIDPDGKERLFGSFPLSGAKGRVIVGFDRSAAIGLIDNYIFIAAAVFLGVTLLAALVVWFIGDRIFVRPVEMLNAFLKTTLDTMDQGLIAIDRHGHADVINMRAMKLLDLPWALATSRPHQDEILKYQNERGEFASPDQFVEITRDIAERRRGIYERRRPNGMVLEVRTVPTEDGGFVRTYSDVTRRSEAEANLLCEKERAVAASHAASDFLTNMSHELRTPLTAIIGVSEMLLKDEPSPEKQRRFMQMQKNAGRQLLAVINDILDFSKIEARQLRLDNEPFRLREAVEYCISIVSETARQKELMLSANIAADVPMWVMGDSERLRQVLLNLLSNAVKFTPSGSVTLDVQTAVASENLLQFVVTDTGVGIEADDLAHIFERFSQADSSTTRRFGGTGLGLAISKKLVALMGGEISAKSEPLKGAVFSFTTPLPSCEEPSLPRDQEQRPRTSHRLLLAEDNELNRQLIRAMLEQAGHHVHVVCDGAAAVRASAEGTYDAVLMDVQMPKLDGYAAAALIRANPSSNPLLPIVALTANALSDESDRCIKAGMSAYFSKPIDWSGLFGAIDRLVEQSRLHHGTRIDPHARPAADERPTLNADTLNRLRSSIGVEATTKLLNLFIVAARQHFSAATDDPDEVRREAHSFGGSAGMLGFDRLSEACASLSFESSSALQREGLLATCRRERDRAVAEIEYNYRASA